METLTGTVHKILWTSKEENNNFKIFILRNRNGKYDTISGDFQEIVEGVSIEVHGDYRDHPKYGKGFRAKAHSFTYDKASSISIALYLQSIAKFVGPVKSHDIAAHFGEELEDIIENHPERLCEVPNIGEKTAQNIVEAWNRDKEEKNVKIFLFSLGLSENNVKKILLRFGIDAETKIKENPYLLCFAGFGFTTCDFIAGKLHFSADDPLRFTHFILWVLKEALNSGHLFLFDHQIIKAINAYNQGTSFKFKSTEITIQDLEVHLIHLENQGYLVRNGDKYYDLDLFFYENESARILSLIAERPDKCYLDHVDAERFIEEYELSQQDPTDPKKFELSEEQRDAIRSFIKEKLLIVTGGPGTGKTTIIKSFVELMIRNRISFELLTPTGIASKKLGVTAGYEAYTIHRRLGYKGKSWDFNTSNKYDTSVIILDEMSMVDMEVFYRLVSALYTHTKLVFVGDNDQLPSVGPGRVLNELIKSGVIKTISLKNIFRQEEQSDIIKEAKKIKEGNIDLSLFKNDPKADIWFIRNQNIKELEKTIIKLAKDLKDQIKTKDLKKTFQIITPRNSGPLSVDTLNIALQGSLNPKIEGDREIYVNGGVIRIGDRVLIRKNDYQLGVFNGDIGKVTKFLATEIIVEIDDYEGKKIVGIPIEAADELLKLAYVITIHKVQGMEYDLVLLPFIKFHGKRILQRNLLYTAITRARKKVIVFGQGSAIVDAIENDKIQDRNTLFSQRIIEWMKDEGISLHQLYSNPNNYQNAENLKQLLLFEERASAELDTTNTSFQKRLENSENPLKHHQFSVPSSPVSLEETLQKMEEEFKDLENLPF